MHGWWMFMPFFWIIFIIICVLFMSRFFGGGFCGRGRSGHDSGIDDLKKEIQALRDEIKGLKDREK